MLAAKTPLPAIHDDRRRGLAAYLTWFRVVDHRSHMLVNTRWSVPSPLPILAFALFAVEQCRSQRHGGTNARQLKIE